MKYHVVIIDDEPMTLKRLRRLLEKEGYHISAFSSPQRALKHLEHTTCDLVISDIQMPGMNGLDLMAKVRGRSPEVEFILITGFASFDGAVEATKEGAFHYLAKPFTPDQLRQRVTQALSHVRTKTAARTAVTTAASPLLPVIIGKSRQIRQVDAQVRQVAPSDINVLIDRKSVV